MDMSSERKTKKGPNERTWFVIFERHNEPCMLLEKYNIVLWLTYYSVFMLEFFGGRYYIISIHSTRITTRVMFRYDGY